MSLPFITLDTTASTLDSTTAFTWDADVTAVGYVALQTSAGAVSYLLGTVRAESISFAREMVRNPYGSTWFQAGDGRVGPQLIRVTAEVWSDAATGIEIAAPLVEALRAAAEDAGEVRVIFGTYFVAALQSFARTPIEAGYRVEMVFVTEDGRN